MKKGGTSSYPVISHGKFFLGKKKNLFWANYVFVWIDKLMSKIKFVTEDTYYDFEMNDKTTVGECNTR